MEQNKSTYWNSLENLTKFKKDKRKIKIRTISIKLNKNIILNGRT